MDIKIKHLQENKGFALVSTIVIMSLMLLIGLGVISLATVESSSSNRSKAQQIAQANARLALKLAIAKLQVTTGPDTRITAPATITSSPTVNNPHWVGVVKTRQDEDLPNGVAGKFAADHHENSAYLTDTRSNGNKPAPIDYLVSWAGNSPADPSINLDNDNSIQLYSTNEGSTPTTVRAPKVSLPDSKGAYAYWVSDNSMKHPLDLNPISNPKPIQQLIAQNSDLTDKLANYDDLSADEIQKLLTLQTANILDQNNGLNILENCAAKSGLFVDTIRSGLRKDISALIANDSISPTSEDQVYGALIQVTPNTPLLTNPMHDATSPRMGIFKSWAGLRFAGTESGINGAIKILPLSEPEQTIQGYASQGSNAVPNINFSRRNLTQNNKSYIMPVVTEASLGWDFTPYTRSDGKEYLRTHLFPRLTMWNPYNVTLKASKYVVILKLPFYGTFTYRNSGSISKWDFHFRDVLTGSPTTYYVGFVTTPTSIPPGETVLFSPDPELSAGPAGASGATIIGSDNSARAFSRFNFNENVLSANGPPSGTNFFYDTNAELKVAETAGNQNANYGFSGNSNNFYAANGHSDEFAVFWDKDETPLVQPINLNSLNSSKYPTVAHFLCQTGAEKRYSKWYAAELSSHAANAASSTFTEYQESRTAPRLWRRGIRMLWLDETAEYNARTQVYEQALSRLSQPNIMQSNLRGGLFYHPGALGAAMQRKGSWEGPFMDSHIYFQQPTDPSLLKTFYPPSPIAAPDAGYPTKVVLYDVPRESLDIASLGQFQHAPFSVLPWQPSFILGNGFSTYQADLDATALRSSDNPFTATDSNRWIDFPNKFAPQSNYTLGKLTQSGNSDTTTTHANEILYYDTSYEINHAFWDQFMLSGITSNAAGTLNWNSTESLPIASYTVSPSSTELASPTDLKAKIENSNWLYYHAAEVITNNFAFNVNCDNPLVWAAFLKGQKNKKSISITSPDGVEQDGLTVLTKSLLPLNDPFTDGTTSDSTESTTSFHALSDDQITTLSENIVEQIKKRGPFLSLSDFINRRLSTDQDIATKGTLDAAIDESRINENLERLGGIFDGDNTFEVDEPDRIPSYSNAPDFKSIGQPGYLTQMDLITPLAPHLTVRGDTFTIRAYGEARDSSGNITARAYCQATVQRSINYVDNSDAAVEPAIKTQSATDDTLVVNEATTGEAGLSKTNLTLGRKYHVVSFRWLSEKELNSSN